METAPLVLAHSHARNAAVETRKANPTAASEEHDLAAGEFANAAKSTSDNEALRTLRLLEQHHLRLAEILKVHPDEVQPFPARSSSPPPVDQHADDPAQSQAAKASSTRRGSQSTSPIPQLHHESSSSLASNLATARGIHPSRRRPGTQSLVHLSPQTAEGRVLNPHRRSHLGDEFRPVPEDAELPSSSLSPSRAHIYDPDVDRTPPPGAPLPVTALATDDPFSRFYSTFNNLITTLSAPLAFAGLPLNPADSPATPTAPAPAEKQQAPPPLQQQPSKPGAGGNRAADPDLARIFSRAALRAVREEHGLSAAAESFYVVPTTGGTMSYAGMLSGARQASNMTDEDGDGEFVDARETPSRRGSPEQSRHGGPGPRHRRATSGAAAAAATAATEAARRAPVGANKTWEELAVENDTLKTVVVDLGDRLRAFELGAQKSSLALHASMRQFATSPSASAVPGQGKVPPLPGMSGATKALEDRARDLEEELRAAKKDMRRLGRENQKYLAVIEKYRERWEALKEGARERVKGGAGAAATEGAGLEEERVAG